MLENMTAKKSVKTGDYFSICSSCLQNQLRKIISI